ncbi:methylated-DNA--[protein]-cysteine S-methyltransferase [Shewanella sp. AS1]|nr:methylated-DNA--[protein]-cysteine S-methyltransferase [Shewanella sp. AS1]
MFKQQGQSHYQPLASLSLQSPIGTIVLAANRYGLTHLTLMPQAHHDWPAREISLFAGDEADKVAAKVHLAHAKAELTDYFSGVLKAFTVPLAPVGTPFQHQVWQALLAQPYGQYCSYSDIASAIDNPKAVRAVGSANGANHIAIIIPCHRIIGKSGTLTGYAYGLDVKQALLNLEGV